MLTATTAGRLFRDGHPWSVILLEEGKLLPAQAYGHLTFSFYTLQHQSCIRKAMGDVITLQESGDHDDRKTQLGC